MASPTQTPTASLTATPTPSLSPPGSLFQIKTSPPLILAFAVVGIFALAMLTRLRMVNGRLVLSPLEVNSGGASTWQRRTGRGQGPMGEDGGIGERPVMWEVWMESAGRRLGKGKEDWDIMPIAAAKYVTEFIPAPPPPSPPPPPPATVTSRVLRVFHSRQKPPQEALSSTPQPSLSEQEDGGSDAVISVAVMIAMPCREEVGEAEGLNAEYCFGLTQVPWVDSPSKESV